MSMSGETPDLDTLLRLADAATPGPWEYVCDDARRNGRLFGVGRQIANIWNAGGAAGHFQGQGHNGPYIAACDPATIRALVLELERARVAIDQAYRLAMLVMGESYDVQMGDSDYIGPTDDCVKLAMEIAATERALAEYRANHPAPEKP